MLNQGPLDNSPHGASFEPAALGFAPVTPLAIERVDARCQARPVATGPAALHGTLTAREITHFRLRSAGPR